MTKSSEYPSYFPKLVVLFSVYFLTAWIGLRFDAVSGFATLVWPPTGIALAALFLLGYRFWPAITAAAFLINYVTGATPFVALGISLGNTLEAVLGTYFLKRMDFQPALERVKDVLNFIIFGALLSTLVSAAIGTSSLMGGRIISFVSYFDTWQAWWIGDMLGNLVVASFIFVWAGRKTTFARWSLNIEKLFFACTLFVMGSTIFMSMIATNNFSLTYLIFIPLLWAALRFGQQGVTAANLLVSVFAILGTAIAKGPFVGASLSSSLLSLQTFMGIISITTLTLAAVVAERTKAENEVRQLNDTLEKRVETRTNELVKSEEKYRAFIEDALDIILTISSSGRILTLNKAWKRVTGWSRAEWVGKNYQPLIHSSDVEKSNAYFRNILEGGVAMPIEIRIATKSGQYATLEVNARPIYEENGIVGIFGISRDVSERVRLREKLAEHTAELEKVVAERTASLEEKVKELKKLDEEKNEFVSIASHQLRSPLTTIQWGLEKISGSERFTNRGKSDIAAIWSAARNLSKLVEIFLNLSRIESGSVSILPEEVELVGFIKNHLKELQLVAEKKKLNITFKPTIRKLIIKTDQYALRNIISSFTSNALEYTPEGGKIEIELQQKDGAVLLAVRDTGIGIPKEEQGKIYQKFMSASNAKLINPGSLGLGLYIAYQAVGILGGKTWFESEVAKGTTFFIQLPMESKPIGGKKRFT